MICTLCPRRCRAERTETEGAGICRMPAAPVVARAALHRWEEPPISGTRGSGTIFFSGCSLRCVFCQNEQISHANYGKPVSLERLREICRELIGQGAHNINLVNPTHYAHVISDLLDRLNFIREVATYDNSVVDALEAARQQVADTEARLEEEKAGQEAALAELESQQAAIQDASDKNDALLAEIQANQSTYASQLAALEAENEELAQDIITSKAEYEAQQAELQRQAEEAERRRQEEEAAAADDSSDSGSSSDAGSSSSGSGGSSSSGSGNVSSGNGSAVVDYAMQFLGNPYVWGGTSLTNGADCSGFTMQVYRHFGVSMSHSSWAQKSAGVAVSASEAQPGDLVFYRSSGSATGGHVGIYIGNNQIISALGSKWGICISSISGKSGLTFRRLV